MKLSELLADLNNRPQTAQVLVVETDFDVRPGNVFTIELVVNEGNENVLILMGKSATRRPLAISLGNLVEDTARWKSKRVYKAEICDSVVTPGKHEVSIDGRALGLFDTTDEAKLFLRGFVLGAEIGTAGKGLDATRNTPWHE